MGMDFKMVIGHKMTRDEIIEFPKSNIWFEVEHFFKEKMDYSPEDKYVKWTLEPSQKKLESYWQAWIDDTLQETIEIDTYFGKIRVYEKTMILSFYTVWWSYGFFEQSKNTKNIIEMGRLFAKYLNTNKVLYIPDGYIKTAIIEDFVTDGLSIEDVIRNGIQKFGVPPKGLSKGRKNYFFVDDIELDVGEIKEWEDEEDFWVWNEELGDSIQIKK